MKLICGYLYSAKQFRNTQLNVFEKRYFVLYPYCGLQWFYRQPEGIVEHDLFDIVGRKEDVIANARGWVFGGNISVAEISVNEIIDYYNVEGENHQDVIYFPFTLKLVYNDQATSVKLAADSIESMNTWIEGIKVACSNMNLVKCFIAANSFPSPELYSVGLSPDSVDFSNLKVDTASVQALITMMTHNGDIIKSISFRNCQLRDHHIQSVIGFIEPQLLQHLCLADNFITDAGINELCSCLKDCKNLLSIDLSSNFITDEGMQQLTAALASCSELQVFNVSRNQLTERSVRPIAKHLAKFSSKLTHFNVSNNQLGDGCASIVALLLKNKLGCLHHFDISFCGVGEVGLGEISSALGASKTIKSANLKGCFSEASVLIPLLETIAKSHKKTSKLPIAAIADDPHAGLVVKFGSLVLEQDKLISLSYKSARSAFPYVDKASLLVDGKVRRKLQFIQMNNMSGNTTHSITEGPESQSLSTMPACIIAFRFALSTLIQSAEEFVFVLSTYLNIDPNQFKILSSSIDSWDSVDNRKPKKSQMEGEEEVPIEADEIRSTTQTIEVSIATITLLLQNPTPSMNRIHKHFLFPKNATKRLTTEALQSLLPQRGSHQTDLPDIQSVCYLLESWANVSHPVLRLLHIRSVFILRSTVSDVFDKKTNLMQTAVKNLKPIPNSAPIHVNLSKSGMLGRGSLDDFVPVLSPTDYVRLFEGNKGYTSNSNDVQIQYNYDMWKKLALNEDGLANKYIKDVGGLVFGDDDEEDTESEAYGEFAMRKSKENAVLRLQAKRERRLKSEELIDAIRELRKTDSLDSATAKFWEAALGNVRYRDNLLAVKLLATSDCGKFRGIACRNDICKAMTERDVLGLRAALTRIESEAFDGGLTTIFGKRLLSELTKLQGDWKHISKIDDNCDYLFLVELFLAECGRLAYRGQEMFAAVELRQALLSKLEQERPNEIQDQLEVIKRRALLSNLMISRDFEGLEREYDDLRGFRDDLFANLPEMQISKILLLEKSNLTKRLKKSLENKNVEIVENSLALAAYFCVKGDAIDRASAFIASIEADTSLALRPLLRNVRLNNADGVYAALKELHRIGWNDPTITLETVTKILTKHNERIKEESYRANLIKIGTLITGGFTVNPFEAARAFQRAKSIPILWQSVSLKSYFDAVEKKIKKCMYPFQQETEILRQIKNKEYESLTVLLSGKGTGKLVMNAPTAELLQTWMERLQRVCSEPMLVGDNPNEQSIIMAGTMEKAARTETGVLRGWRKRYFILQGSILTYFTQAGGEKKGAVRVKGGILRLMNPSECGGRQYCIELQEGRDLSILDPDLIEEAKLVVAEGKKADLEASLMTAIDCSDMGAIASLLQQVYQTHAKTGFQLSMVAETLVRNFNLSKVKILLKDAILSTPKAQLEAALRQSENLYMDAQNPSVLRLDKMTQMSELTVAIVRVQDFLSGSSSAVAFGAIETNQFRKLFSYLNRFDMKRFTSSERRLLISVMIQYSAMALMCGYQYGECLPYLIRLIKHAITCSSHFHTETEALQLARLCISLGSRSLGGDLSEVELVVRGEKRQDFTAFIEENRISGNPNVIYAIDKYGLLNLASDNSSGGLFASLLQRRPSVTHTAKGQSEAVSLLSFSSNSITKSILRLQIVSKDKSNPDNISPSEVCRLFDALQVVMGDRPMASIESSKSSYKTTLITGKHQDIVDVAMELINAGIRHAPLVDELYVQLCKQLSSSNHRLNSMRQGWVLFSLYLHYFAPSVHFLPYLQNFIFVALREFSFSKFDEKMELHSTVAESVNEYFVDTSELHSAAQIVVNLMHYCTQLLTVIEMSYRGSNSTAATPGLNANVSPLSSTSNAGNIFVPKELKRVDVEYALLGHTNTIELTLLTGSKYLLPVCYGEVTNPMSVLQLAYSKYSGINEGQLLTQLKKQNEAQHSSDKDIHDAYLLRAFYASLYRGFGLYFHTVHDGNDAEDANENDQDRNEEEIHKSEIQLIDVQPEERQFIDWKYDLLWDTMNVATTISASKAILAESQRNAVGTEEEGEAEAERAEDARTVCASFIVRRRVAVASEKFASQIEMFGDEVGARDAEGIQLLWEQWLSRPHSALPLDYARIDLLFADETRYVNSGLYGSSDYRVYLLAMQLALSWEDESSSDWGEGHSAILSGCDLSVRPIFKFPITTDLSESIDGSVQGDQPHTNRLSMSAEQFRKSVFQQATTSLSVIQEATESGTSMMDDEDADNESEESEQVGENAADGDEESNGEVSLYSSEDYDEHSDPEEEMKQPKQPIRSFEQLSEDDIEEVQYKLLLMGFDQQSDLDVVKVIVEQVASIHNLAVELSIPTSSPRFRYLIKRAYLEYVSSLPLFASNFSMGKIVDAGLADSVEQNTSIPVAMPEVPLNINVLMVVNCNGILLLDPEDWTIVLQSPLFDVEGVSSVPIADAEDADSDYNSTLIININGLDISIQMNNASELQSIVEACVGASLSNGAFPSGTLWSNYHPIDGLDNFVPNKLAFRSFVDSFPFLPSPPIPPALLRSMFYFNPPKSSREILAEERLKEELLEEAVAKLAAEAQAEKNQLKLEEGRHAVQSFDNENGSDNSDDEKRASKDKASSKRRMTKRRDNVTRMTMGVNAEQVLKMQITAAVTGVPTKKSRIAHVSLDPPLRRGGKIKLDAYDRVRIDDAPIISIVARSNVNTLRPVSCLWPSPSSSVVENLKRSTTFTVFPSSKPSIQATSNSALYMTSSGQFAVRQVANTDTTIDEDSKQLHVSSWPITTLQFPIKRQQKLQETNDLVAFVMEGKYASLTTEWKGITINAYLPCMGVYGHIKSGKKKKSEIPFESVKVSDVDIIGADETFEL